MKKLLIAAIALLVTAPAMANFPVDIVLRWQEPTEREDGTPLAQDELARYDVYCSKGGVIVFERQIPNDLTVVGEETYSEAGALSGSGTYECVMYAIDTEGRISDPSNTASKKVTGRPGAPIILEFNAGRQ